MSVKRRVTMYNDSAAGTSNWFQLDYRYDHAPFRTINVSMNSSDSVVLQATTYDIKGGPDLNQITVPASEIVTLKTYAASGEDVVQGPWAAFRIVNTGTAGVATVNGLI